MFSCSSTSSSTLWLPARPYRMFLCQLYCVHKHMVHTVISTVSPRAYVVCVQDITFRIVPHFFLFPLSLLLLLPLLPIPSPSLLSLLSFLSLLPPLLPSLLPSLSSFRHYSYLHLDSTTKTKQNWSSLVPQVLPASFCSQHRLVVWSSTSSLPTLSLSSTR